MSDQSASLSERDDAAIDLGGFDEALDELIDFASNHAENCTLLGSCGTSIAEIWRRTGSYDESLVQKLAEAARAEISASFA